MTTQAEAAEAGMVSREPEGTLLERRIAKYKIPSSPYAPLFDRIVVYILPEEKAARDTFIPGGKIQKSEEYKEAEKRESPRGVLIAAGLKAMDILRGHGVDLGHIVWLARFSPWRHEVDRDENGKPIELMFLRAGDIVGSEDVRENMDKRLLKVKFEADGQHRFVMDGSVLPRFDPKTFIDD